MSEKFKIYGPTTDGSVISTEMSADYDRAYFNLRFFSDPECTVQVTPTSGTCVVTGTPDLVNYKSIDAYGTITASDVYTLQMPTAMGPMRKFKATMTGIAGAAYFTLECVRK